MPSLSEELHSETFLEETPDFRPQDWYVYFVFIKKNII